MEKDTDILKTRAKEYQKDLNQVISIPTSKSKKKPQRIVFMKCSDHVGTTSNLWLDENPQCLSCIKFESLQTLKPGVLARCFDVISLLTTKRAQKTGKEVNSFYQCAILKDCWKSIVKLRNLRKKSGTYLQKSSEFLSIQRNLFDIIVKFFVFFSIITKYIH